MGIGVEFFRVAQQAYARGLTVCPSWGVAGGKMRVNAGPGVGMM